MRMHRDGRGGSREEFPSPPGRSWLPAMARGGLGWQAQASNPNLAEGRKVELCTGKQLFAALPGMREQSRVAGIGAGAAGGGALRGRLLTQLVKWGLRRERQQPLRSWAAPFQHTAAEMLGYTPRSWQCCRALLPCAGGKIIKKAPLPGTNRWCGSS